MKHIVLDMFTLNKFTKCKQFQLVYIDTLIVYSVKFNQVYLL